MRSRPALLVHSQGPAGHCVRLYLLYRYHSTCITMLGCASFSTWISCTWPTPLSSVLAFSRASFWYTGLGDGSTRTNEADVAGQRHPSSGPEQYRQLALSPFLRMDRPPDLKGLQGETARSTCSQPRPAKDLKSSIYRPSGFHCSGIFSAPYLCFGGSFIYSDAIFSGRGAWAAVTMLPCRHARAPWPRL